MLTNQPFDIDHLKKVIEGLEKAAKVLEKKKKEVASSGGLSSLGPQMKREKFIKEVVDTSLFKSLQQEFFKIIPKVGQEILTICSDAYNKQKLTNEQRDALAKIGNKLASELPFNMLSGSISLKQGFSNFVGALRMIHEFFTGNPSVALSVGSKILSILKPLENFITKTKETVKKSDVPQPIKEGFQERLDLIQTHTNKVTEVVQSAIAHPVQQPSIDLAKLAIGSPVMQSLQQSLLAAIFPIGGTILNVGFSLFNSGILNDKQRNGLGGIGMEIMSLPFKLLTGKTDLNGVLTGLTNSLKSLGKFFISNPDIAVRAGAAILPALFPLGGFLKNAVDLINKSELAQNAMGGLLKAGLGLLSNQFGNVEDTLEKSALRVLETPQK